MATEENKELFTKVKQIISEQLGVDEDEVTTTASFVDDLGADSLDQVELVMALEEKFEIEIPDDDAKSCVPSRMQLITSKNTPRPPARSRHKAKPRRAAGFAKESHTS